MEHIEFVYTLGMEEGEIAAALRDGETGVLALADGGRAYTIPVAYHYDGTALFFRLGDDDHSKKLDFIEATTEACFLRYGHEGTHDSWSIIGTGTLDAVDRNREDFDAATINEQFESLRVFDESIDALELRLFRLELESITGRRTTG